MSKITHSEHYKVKKTIIYKVKDADDSSAEPMYLTLKALRSYVINDLWVGFEAHHDANQELSQEDLAENDENIFAYLQIWNIKVERIILIDLI